MIPGKTGRNQSHWIKSIHQALRPVVVFSNDSQYAYFVSTQNSDGYGDIKRIRIEADFKETIDTTSQLMVVKDQKEEQFICL